MRREGREASLSELFEDQVARSPDVQARFAGALVLAQVSLSLTLLVAAGLFVRTFSSLADLELGFVPERVLVVDVNARRAGVEPTQRSAFYDRLREVTMQVPGVTHAALSFITPVSGSQWNGDLLFPNKPDLAEEDRIVNYNYLSPGWFEMMQTPIIAGRDFDSRDRFGGVRTALVNQKFADKYFDGESPLGKIVRTPSRPDEAGQTIEIIGLVGDAVYETLRDPLTPTMYWAMAQDSALPSTVSITVRTQTANPAELNAAISAALLAQNADLTMYFRPLEDFIRSSLSQERLIAMLSGFFGVLALLLAALGLYGITAYAVIRRRAEIGIRLALGATPGDVVRGILSRTGALVLGGILVGGLASWWAARFVSALLFNVPATDLATIGGAMLGLAVVGALAGWIPARRAAAIDPAEALREG